MKKEKKEDESDITASYQTKKRKDIKRLGNTPDRTSFIMQYGHPGHSSVLVLICVSVVVVTEKNKKEKL
jgi:hypothetical protein